MRNTEKYKMTQHVQLLWEPMEDPSFGEVGGRLVGARESLLVMVMSPKVGVQLVRDMTSLWFVSQTG